MKLTDFHKATLGAFAELPDELGLPKLSVSIYVGTSAARIGDKTTYYAHTDVCDTSISGSGESLADAVQQMLDRREEELAKPPEERPLKKPSEVVQLTKEHVASNNPSGPELVEWLDSLTVKE